MNKIVELKPVKKYEVFVSSIFSERKWKITVKAFGHAHAYREARSLNNVNVLSTRQLIDNEFANGRSFGSY